MKLQALMIAVALAAGTTAFAQTPNYGSASSSTSTTASATHKTEVHKKVAKAKHHRKEMHASAKHARHQMHASAKHARHTMHASAKHARHEMQASAHHNTRVMGAGPARPSTDLNARARQERMDRAYADWRATHR